MYSTRCNSSGCHRTEYLYIYYIHIYIVYITPSLLRTLYQMTTNGLLSFYSCATLCLLSTKWAAPSCRTKRLSLQATTPRPGRCAACARRRSAAPRTASALSTIQSARSLFHWLCHRQHSCPRRQSLLCSLFKLASQQPKTATPRVCMSICPTPISFRCLE